MRSLTFAGETFEAEEIVKLADSIIGYTNGAVVFSFRGISDFEAFSLDGEYDPPKEQVDKNDLAARLATAEAETAALNLAIIDIWETLAATQ
jgi:hypothetical protein